ncbi:Kinesin-like protein KIN-7D mitochondrial [Bienertia sinuspersici]
MSSRARSSSPFSYRRTASPYSSSSSTSSFMNTSGRFIPRSNSSSSSSFHGSTGNNNFNNSNNNNFGSRSMTPSRNYGGRSPVNFSPSDDLLPEPFDPPRPSSDSISVTVRFRPMSDREYQRGDESSWYPDGDKTVRSEYSPATAYAFDKVFGPNATTEEVYDIAGRPVVKTAMDGVNGTVFAYGVTSSGKTHTMHGDQMCPGIIPLAIKDVFSIIQETPGREFLLRVSYLEIYNEVINDLLDPTGQNLRVREDVQGTYVEGVKEEVVLSPGHALSFIAAGEEHRHVGSNNFNLFSSRSHTIFSLMIESSAHGDDYDGVIFSQLLDPRAPKRKQRTKKKGRIIYHKKSLTLGTVIGKLSEGKASHIPYRDSKLTRLLQSSLSGRGHVSLICTVTPASSSMEETHNTLKFASRAKRVEIFASRNKIIDEKSLIKKYQREISTLKEELDQLRRGMLVGVSHEEILTLKQKLEEGQVKMQSRLEEEEEAKAALMSRIQRLTKLILKPELEDVKIIRILHLHCQTLLVINMKISSKWNDEFSAAGDILAESNEAGDLISGSNLTTMDLLVEQVKMLAGEIAFSTSTLKRLVEQSSNDPDASRSSLIWKVKSQEKRKQMRLLEQRIIQSGEASEMENEKLKLEHVQLVEEKSGLCVQNQKLSEEASYAKELASAAAVELKNLAAEVTKISLQNAKLEKELQAAREFSHSRGPQMANGGNRKYGDVKTGRKGRHNGRVNEVSGGFYDEFDSYNLDMEDLKMELQARKQREAALEAALADKEYVEEECLKKVEEAKKREAALENDLANMWVLVAKLKKEVGGVPESLSDNRLANGDILNGQKPADVDNNDFRETQSLEINKATQDVPSEEPLVARLKARMQEMKEKKRIWAMERLIPIFAKFVTSHLQLQYSFLADIFACVNLVHWLVQSVQYAAQI